MDSIRWMSGKPVGVSGAHAPARFRHAAMLASVCDYGQAVVVGEGTASGTVGINGRPRGLEGRGTG